MQEIPWLVELVRLLSGQRTNVFHLRAKRGGALA
jgi:hypothetical protein